MSAERIIDGILTVVFVAVTVFACSVLGAAVDTGNPTAVVIASFLALCGMAAVAFFGRDFLSSPRQPDAEAQEREAWDALYERPPTYRRVYGQPDTPFDLDTPRGQR